MFDLAVGSVAPVLSLREDEEPSRRPRILAFIRAWSMESEDLSHVRERLAQLDTELVIVSDDEGAWSFVRDAAPVFCDRLAGDITTASAAYGVTADAVFVIDRGVVRFVHRPDRSLSATLTEALDAAAEALAWRDHQTKLERIQWTPREWTLKSLVTGCSLTFLAGPPSAAHRRFARGTGPVVKYESRDVITPGADTDAPASHIPEVSEWPTAPSLRRLD